MRTKNFPEKQNVRRSRSLSRLNAQLADGTKNTLNGVELLTDSDKKRINKEIEILKNRVYSSLRGKRTKKVK